MARKTQRSTHKRGITPLVGKKGGMAIAAGAALGGIAGAAMGGVAGAVFANRAAREKVGEAVGTAGKYAAAVDTIAEEYPMMSRGKKGGRSSRKSR